MAMSAALGLSLASRAGLSLAQDGMILMSWKAKASALHAAGKHSLVANIMLCRCTVVLLYCCIIKCHI